MQNPPINNQNNDENQFSEGLINFFICTRTNTVKIIHSPDATGKITIKEFVIHNNINYIIQEIDDNAFSGTQIESLTFEPNSHVKRIGNYAFQKSTIKSIEIPDSLEELGETWCSEANYLTDIKINNNHPKFIYKDKLLTTLDGSEIIFANRNIVRLNLTTNVHKILPSAFYKCSKITSISIKTSTIEYIGPSAFYECEKLQSILITGENLQNLTLDERCFAFCQSLKKIDINCNSLKIGYNCFECCVSIEELIFPVKNISFDEGSVSGCENLSSLKIPDAENIEIKSKSFIGLYQLKEIHFKTNEYEIFRDSFEHCTSIKSLHFEAEKHNDLFFLGFLDSLQSINLISRSQLTINNYLFSRMKGLESLKLKSKELILGEGCFHDPDIFHQNIENLSFIRIECENQITITSKFLEGCHKLKSFKIVKGDNLDRTEKIIFNERSFHDTENLEEIEIVANDINIGNSCFYSLKKLKKIDLHAKNITIGENSFEECDSIESLILTEQNDVIEKIDFAKECFSKIGNLYKIDITANDINFGINCFNNSKKLQEVTLHCKNAIINDNCFSECCSIKSFVIATLNQAGVNKIDLAKQCFFKAENLNKVELTANEINFSSNCFTGSQKLKFVVLHAKNINIGDNCFTECGSLQSFIVSEAKNIGITDKIKIEEQCFINSKNLQQIEIKANDINLGNGCLKGSQKIKNVALYCKNITINDNCFTMCSIKSFKILKLDGIEFIEKINLAEKCFFNSKDLQQIEIMSNDINIGSSCFNGSKNIQKIILHGKNITIGDNCFVECPIKSFIVSETRNIGVTEKINLSEKCFFNTNNLQQIEITANDINIGSSCFNGSTDIQKIILNGKNITVNDNCFTGCSIKSFVVSETRNIGITEKINLSEKCFFNTNNLQQIEITANDINLDKNCFNGSKNIQKIILHGKNITIGDNCFTSCSIESLKIMELSKNDNINKINLVKECFCNITVLKEIEIKANEIFVGENCFKEASDLQKVLISGNKVTISDSCFNNCISLDIFTVLYRTSISIGHKQFFQCNNLKTISIRFLSYGYNFILEEFNLANDCFLGADNLDKFELCGGEIIISNEILHCSSISTLAILSTESVVINSNTFNDSGNLKEIIITSNSLTINQNCFNRIPNLLSISFECFYIDIQSDCFNNIENCQSVKFKKANHITFDSNDFCDWKNLTDIEMDAINTLNIGPKCFIKSEKLKNLSFYSKNITIGTESFQNCNSLDSVNFIPKIIYSSMTDISKSFTKRVQSIEVLYIGDKSFIECSNLNKLTIIVKGEVIICDECFYGLDNLYNIIIKANTATFGKDSFHKCPGLKNAISVKVSEDDASNKRINYILTNLTKPIKTKFKNDSNFISFFVLGINRYSKRPSYISMFPARPVTINNANIELIPSLCYPQGPKQIPFKLLNRSKIITGFVFYIDNNESVGVGVALHICISPLAKSFVGNKYDRSYPFCICLISNNPNIASHFSFLCEIVDPIIGNITLPEDPKVNIPASLRNCKGEPIRFLHVRSNSEYISLSPSCRSMNFLLPQLVQYYTSPFLKEIQNEYLLYPTLQTLISILPPRLIAELFFCLICEFRIILNG